MTLCQCSVRAGTSERQALSLARVASFARHLGQESSDPLLNGLGRIHVDRLVHRPTGHTGRCCGERGRVGQCTRRCHGGVLGSAAERTGVWPQAQVLWRRRTQMPRTSTAPAAGGAIAGTAPGKFAIVVASASTGSGTRKARDRARGRAIARVDRSRSRDIYTLHLYMETDVSNKCDFDGRRRVVE